MPTPYPLEKQVYGRPSRFMSLVNQLIPPKQNIPLLAKFIENKEAIEGKCFETYFSDMEGLIDQEWWLEESIVVYGYVFERQGVSLGNFISVAFSPPASGYCAPRGITVHDQQPAIIIFADQMTSREQILAAFAHELGHVLIHQQYPGLNDIALDEGRATWAAGDYWTEWKDTGMDDAVRLLLSKRHINH
jgi:hypothetical protein